MEKQALTRSVNYITSWLKFRYEQEEIPGFVVTIAHKGKVIMNEAYGFSDLEKKTTLTTNGLFRIASHSKTFTATALMQLQERGKLRIDDPVVHYLPWLKTHKDTRWEKITIRQLMSHGAGVIRDGLDADYWQLERPFPSHDELKSELLKANIVLENNTKLKYSNFGYSLLGMVIEAVSGKPYNQYVSENIIQTLGLNNMGPDYTADIADKLVTGYTRRDAHKARLPIAHIATRSMSAATGFYSTAEDLCAYFAAHFTGSRKLLDDESKKEMRRVQWRAKTPGQDNHEDYGLGLELEYLRGRKTIGHGGGFPGHISKTIVDPDDELVIVVLTNCLDGPASVIAKSIYNIIYYFQNNTLQEKPKHDLSKFEGRYTSLWATIDIIASGNSLVATYPGTWQPLSYTGSLETLSYIDDTTLKVTDTDSFYSEGELVQFTFKNNRVALVNYNGTTMWPDSIWRKKQGQRSIVELKVNP